MKRTIFSTLALAIAVILISATAYSWNFATHAYIAEKIGKALPLPNANEIYGIMAPDLYNFEFSLMDDLTLRGLTHGIPKDDPAHAPSQAFMQVWWKAKPGMQKSDAFGYVAHNDAWGADYIAHWKALPYLPPFPPPYKDQPPGYIIALAVQLDKLIESWGVWDYFAEAGIPLGIPERMMFCHNIVEYAGDIIIKRADPLIGKKIYESCLLRSPEFPELLNAVFPAYYNVVLAEAAYRDQMAQYGLLLTMDEDSIVQNVAQQMAEFSIQYLAYITNQNPSDFEPFRDMLVDLSYNSIYAGVEICKAGKYMNEVNLTVLWVRIQLLLHHVTYGLW
jgi:hypothetical protein